MKKLQTSYEAVIQVEILKTTQLREAMGKNRGVRIKNRWVLEPETRIRE